MKWELLFLDWIQANLRCDFLDALMPAVTKLGNFGLIWIILSIAFLLNKKTRKVGLALTVALCIDLILCNLVLKPMVGRIRPFTHRPELSLLIPFPIDASFPSGHTAAGFTIVTALFCMKWRRMGAVVLVVATMIAFSRLYLYVHFPTDVIGGMLTGIVAGLLGVILVEYYQKRKND